MLKVGIKYCGGCNPGYDRVALADYIKKSLHGRVEFVPLDNEKIDFVRAKGLDAAGPLMGAVMKELRGRVDGKAVNEVLKRKISELNK